MHNHSTSSYLEPITSHLTAALHKAAQQAVPIGSPPPISPLTLDQSDVLSAFLDGHIHLPDAISGRHLTVAELADWVQDPNVLTVLAFLKELHALRAEHLVQQARVHAFARLSKFARLDPITTADAEIARKACANILRYSEEKPTPKASSKVNAKAGIPPVPDTPPRGNPVYARPRCTSPNSPSPSETTTKQ